MADRSNLADYADATIYDLENDSFEPDGPFYLELARRSDGRVLDLGCGTGRITIPLARDGIDICGADLAPEMLARAREKSGDLPIRWVEASATDFRIDEPFDLIIATGDMFRHLLRREDQEAMFARVLEHLAVGGQFVASILFPRPHMMQEAAAEQHWHTLQHEDGHEIRVSGTDEYDPVAQVTTDTAYRRWCATDGEEVLSVAPLSLRLIFPEEMSALLHYNGFDVVERYGDWSCEPVTPECSEIVYVCRARGH